MEQYKSTAFNTCEIQQLPIMTGPPLKLHIDPDERPFAVHKPVNVSLHWQERSRQTWTEIAVLEY